MRSQRPADRLRFALALVVAAVSPVGTAVAGAGKAFVPTSAYETRTVRGWTVRVNKALLKKGRADLGGRALRLLGAKLGEVERAVPPGALKALRRVPIWLGVDDGHAPCAEYHPSAGWLKENGYNPDKAKGVEIGCAEKFLEWSKGQPMMVFHELSHAYHDQVLGFDDASVQSAYETAMKSGSYNAVRRNDGSTGKAYAAENAREYFAEGSEAFFGANDFYPFIRADLEKHDPALFQALKAAWGRD